MNYEMNVLGVKGPRQMCVILPGMDAKYNREDFIQYNSGDTLSVAWKKIYSNIKPSKSPAEPAVGTEPSSSATITAASTTTNMTATPTATTNYTTKPGLSKLSSIRRSLFQSSRTQSIEKSVDSTSARRGQIGYLSSVHSNEYRNVVKLVNKSPEWNKELGSFALNFHGRVAMSSVKNLQIVHEANPDYVCMQFGKVNKDLYTCDYSYPFCALQAFALALTSLDNKLGCD